MKTKNLKVSFTRVNNLHWAVEQSGLPLRADLDTMESLARQFERADKLSGCKQGSGHDSFLKLIHVAHTIEAPQYWWLQFMRYSFHDIGSSQSKMHKIHEMNIRESCTPDTTLNQIETLELLIDNYKTGERKVTRDEIMANVPMGLKLTAGVTSNYLQLKTIYNQRRMHPLQAWQEYCDWIEILPHSEWITGEDE